MKNPIINNQVMNFPGGSNGAKSCKSSTNIHLNLTLKAVPILPSMLSTTKSEINQTLGIRSFNQRQPLTWQAMIKVSGRCLKKRKTFTYNNRATFWLRSNRPSGVLFWFSLMTEYYKCSSEIVWRHLNDRSSMVNRKKT